MMARAIICCAALILGLLATLGATAQSAEKNRPLDLMGFMRGDVRTSANTPARATARKPAGKTAKHRHGTRRSAARTDKAPDTVVLPRPAPLMAGAATAYASQAENQARHDVQVVTSDELNTIDLAMLRSAPETVGATQKAVSDVGDRTTTAEAGQVRDQAQGQVPDQAMVANNDDAAASPSDAPRDDNLHESWMGRIWSAVGDGFVALVAAVRQLFA